MIKIKQILSADFVSSFGSKVLEVNVGKRVAENELYTFIPTVFPSTYFHIEKIFIMLPISTKVYNHSFKPLVNFYLFLN